MVEVEETSSAGVANSTVAWRDTVPSRQETKNAPVTSSSQDSHGCKPATACMRRTIMYCKCDQVPHVLTSITHGFQTRSLNANKLHVHAVMYDMGVRLLAYVADEAKQPAAPHSQYARYYLGRSAGSRLRSRLRAT